MFQQSAFSRIYSKGGVHINLRTQETKLPSLWRQSSMSDLSYTKIKTFALIYETEKPAPRSRSREELRGAMPADGRGLVIIENAASKAEMDALAKDLQDQNGLFRGAVGSFAGCHTLRNAGKPLGESAVARRLAANPLIVESVRELLKPWCKRVVLGTCSSITVEPPPTVNESPAPAQVLHRDEHMWAAAVWPFLPCSPIEGRPEFCVSVMWAISDFRAENGATRFIPGSNTWACRAEDFCDTSGKCPAGIIEELATPAEMAKGSVVLWSGGTLHGAGAHAPRTETHTDANGSRHGLLFIYNLGWLRSEHNFHFALPSRMLSSFRSTDPELAALVGLTGENAVQHEWYSGPVYAQPYLGAPSGSASGDGVQYAIGAKSSEASANG